MKETGSKHDDLSIYMLMEDFKEVFNQPADEFDMIVIETERGYNVGEIAKKISYELEDARGNDNFIVITRG